MLECAFPLIKKLPSGSAPLFTGLISILGVHLFSLKQNGLPEPDKNIVLKGEKETVVIRIFNALTESKLLIHLQKISTLLMDTKDVPQYCA